jgi:hypothetical protein
MKQTLLALVTGAIALLSWGAPTRALESLQLLFGQEFPPVTLTANDLQRLANTGVVPQDLTVMLTVADLEPRRIQSALNFELPVDRDQLQQSLSGTDREVNLTLLAHTFGLSLAEEQMETLGEALLTTSRDGKLTLVELLTVLPVQTYSVDAFVLPVRARRSLLVLRRMGVNVDAGLTALGQVLPNGGGGSLPQAK